MPYNSERRNENQEERVQSTFGVGIVGGNACRRWLKLFAGFGRVRGQAQGLPLPSADLERQRAGTRPAPT